MKGSTAVLIFILLLIIFDIIPLMKKITINSKATNKMILELVERQKNQIAHNNFMKWHEDDVDPSEMDEYNYNSEVK